MDIYIIWLTKLILAHLLTDFMLQPTKWIQSRSSRHFTSGYLYIHGLTTALIALLFIGYHYWVVALIILVTHILIDGWKSYQPDKTKYFLIDQALHFLVIIVCWYLTFLHPEDIISAWNAINNRNTWIFITSLVFLTQPSGILIGQLTKKWRNQLPDADSLGNAGKWIGIIERILILVFIYNHQYASVGLMITAKSLLRFNEPNRQEVKTEYLLIGTLISFSVAVVIGIMVLQMTRS